MTAPSLADWLLARIDAWEALAQACGGAEMTWGAEYYCTIPLRYTNVGALRREGAGRKWDHVVAVAAEKRNGRPEAADPADLLHIAKNDPAFVRAQCTALRRVVEEYKAELARDRPPYEYQTALGWCVKALAQPWAGHPDWREEWSL